MYRLFKEHPETVGETYLQHMHSASYFGIKMLGGAFCCFVHAFLPFLFEKTGSRIIVGLHDRMVLNRSRTAAPAPQTTAVRLGEGKA